MNTPLIIGRQTFDGLGRQLSVEAAGYITQFEYTEGLLPPTANILADGKRVDFTYEPSLSNKLLSVKPQGEAAQQLTYHPLGMPASASGALGTEAFGFTTAGQPQQDTWTVDEQQHNTLWLYSMNGLLQGFKDGKGEKHRRHFDAQGRVQQTQVGNLTTCYSYDGLSRPVSIIVEDPDNLRTMITALTYDALGREATRIFTTTAIGDDEQPVINTFTQTLAYSALDQITSRTWAEGDKEGKETFEYDIRGRLVTYTANEHAAPQDPFGNCIVRQVFTFNALNGHEKVVTDYADETTDVARFTYAKNNPVQVVKVTHTHPSWPDEVTLNYDACGRVISDNLGRRMVWNAQDRLTEVRLKDRTCQYGYTANDRLADRTLDGTLSRSFFSGEELTHDQSGDNRLQYHSGEQGLFAISKLADGIRQTTLLGSDAQGSIRLEADSTVRTRHYGAYGVERHDNEHVPFGYAGQRHEPLTGWQILGDYRPYDPVLMCFLSPDSESPFGRGGINPYAYCAGDPVNRIDPDGNSWVEYLRMGVGVAIGIAALAASLGTLSLALAPLLAGGLASLTPSAALAIGAASLSVVSSGTRAIARGIEISGGDERAVKILGWISTGTGIASGLLNVHTTIKSAKAGVDKLATLYRTGKWPSTESSGFQQFKDATSYTSYAYSGVNVAHNNLGMKEDAVSIPTDARREIAPRLTDHEQGRPLVLPACQGGSSGMAQTIANVLRRPVTANDASTNPMQQYFRRSETRDTETGPPLRESAFSKRLAGYIRPDYEVVSR